MGADKAIAVDGVADCKVTLYVSSGPEENLVSLQNLIREHKDNVESKLNFNKLKLGEVTEAYHETIPAGYVCAMSPEYSAGAKIGQGTTVDITISKGKLPPLVLTVETPVYETETLTISSAKILLKLNDQLIEVSEEEIDLTVQPMFTFDGIKITQFPQTYSLYYSNDTVGEVKIRDIKITGYEEVEGMVVAKVEAE